MTEIPLKKIGLGFLLLVAVLLLVNIFVIMPFLSTAPTQIRPVLEEAVEIMEPAPAVLRVDSLSVIKKDSAGEGAGYTDLDVQALRNPFIWPEEKSQPEKTQVTKADKPVAARPAAAKPEPPKPRLSMVLISEGDKQALLDGVFLREGDMFHGYKVRSIRDNEVVLSGNFGDLSIFLENREETEQQHPVPGGIIER